ncbi:permease prefix domain 1-containing protein [Alkalihalobacterium elongatum]|uniref:permease prefix domain 1-containing protein n=1 Tax=Alkalihalobacterium elongatum TaxID=2675466 RepID=UPI001C1F5F34|nr:permease prefix domain 1-containing protein [Alkalihalobacterium elongatum]
MKQIEAFVDEVYHSVGGNREEIEELKSEMKNHLLEAVLELKKEGKTEQEAIEIAIERFGGEKEMRSVVGQLFQTQKVFAKRILYIALIFFALTSIVSGVLWILDEADMNENLIVAREIINSLEGQEVISENMKAGIFALVEDKSQILNLQIYKMADVERVSETGSVSYHWNEATPVYEYGVFNSSSKPNWMLIDLGYSLGSTEWYVQMESVKLFGFIPFIFNAGIAIYATLFTVWATINAYHHRRLNAGWVIAFALLNVFGYLIYILVGKKKVTA